MSRFFKSVRKEFQVESVNLAAAAAAALSSMIIIICEGKINNQFSLADQFCNKRASIARVACFQLSGEMLLLQTNSTTCA